jgi:hypothetical protein
VPRSSYYHRQADLCMRMALSASTRDERIRLVELANEYRHKASQAELLILLRATAGTRQSSEPRATCLWTRPCTHKSRSVSSGWSMSGLLPKADIRQRIEHVCFVPKADISP